MQRKPITRTRLKRCSICREPFQPHNTLVKVCGVACAVVHAQKQQAAEWKRQKKEYVKQNKTKPQLTKIAQDEFNKFIRLRDHDKPCISCETLNPGGNTSGGKWDCGHFCSVGSAPELRFEEKNAHRQCKRCNSYLSGNIVEYRKGLIVRIGIEWVEWLEGPHEAPNHTHAELREIAAHYRAASKQLKKLLEQQVI